MRMRFCMARVTPPCARHAILAHGLWHAASLVLLADAAKHA
jgi:hypothetical protein